MLIENMFNSLFSSSNYFRLVIPHLHKEYFVDKTDGILLSVIKSYHETYNKHPTYSSIKLVLENNHEITTEDTDNIYKKIEAIRRTEKVADEELLLKTTEDWCRDRALEIATLDFVTSLEKNDKDKNAKVEKIRAALGLEFDVKIGHDFQKDAKLRFNWYQEDEDKIPLDIEVLNLATGGGLVKKSMFIIMSSTNTGKTVNMCHHASALVMTGKNVLYISGEESEREILKKNDANILDISVNELGKNLDKDLFKSRFSDFCATTHGVLKVKEFPTGVASSLHIRNLLMELRLKENFVPDVVLLDGINNFASSKIPAAQTGTAIYVKSVAEEQRALAVEFNYALLTNAQFNRGAKSKNEKATLEDVGEAYAISQTGDWACSLIQTDELRDQGKYLIVNLKTRFGGNKGKVYVIGINYDRMRLFNLNETEQEDIPLHIKDTIAAHQKKVNEKEEAGLFFEYEPV
jgi:archaellum biogenesis ATPase FlaH